MSSILQAQQFYTAGIPLLEAYLLPMANDRTRNERLNQLGKLKISCTRPVKERQKFVSELCIYPSRQEQNRMRMVSMRDS